MSLTDSIRIDQPNSSYSALEYDESECDPDDERWDDWEEDEGAHQNPKCLFCKELFPTSGDLFLHCKEHHGFDFQKIRTNLKLDFYQSIRLINYIRKQVLENPELENVTSYSVPEIQNVLSEDAYLKPVLDEDPLLYGFEDDEIEEDFDERLHLRDPEESSEVINITTPLEKDLLERLRIAEERLLNTQVQLKSAEVQFDEYRQMVKESFFDTYSDDRSEKSVDLARQISNYEEGTNHYFNSYAKNDIHEEMLKDRIRTESYRDFIYEHKDLFKGKVVLDVGCGTCILSMFAAKAGAARVFSVDKSDIIHRAKEIVKENQLDDVITLINSKVEEVELPVQKVDIIISEWMGYFLFFEAMLYSLIVARDRWLAPDGILAPSQCRLLLTAIEDEDLVNDTFNFWNDVYGFKMSAMKTPVRKSAIVDFVKQQAIISNVVPIKEVPLHVIRKHQLDFTSPFTLEIIRDGYLHGFLGYFDTWFTRDGHDIPLSQNAHEKVADVVSFTTGPYGEMTHWRQTIFFLEHAIPVNQGTIITGSFDCRKSTENPRDLDFEIRYKVTRAGDDVNKVDELVQKFYLR